MAYNNPSGLGVSRGLGVPPPSRLTISRGGYGSLHPNPHSSISPRSDPTRMFESMDEHVRKRPSMMSDFKHAHPIADTSRRDLSGNRLSQLDLRNRHGPAYSPQVENISPTPEDEPGPSRSQIADKLEKVEIGIRGTEAHVKRLEKKQQELEEASKDGHVEEDLEEEATRHLDPFERILAENRRKAAASHAVLDKLAPPLHIPCVPIYREPSDIPALIEQNEKFQTFKPVLIAYIRGEQEARARRERYLTEKYNTLHTRWAKKVDKWENSPKKIARDQKNRELFERVFPELKKQREEREKNTRVETRTSVLGTTTCTTTVVDDGDEDCKMHQQAVIPPILLDARTRARSKYINNNGLIRDAWAEHTQRLDYFAIAWSEDEKRIFKENIATYGKNFAAIAVFLDRKTTQDCVQYYYLTKKRANYKQVMRKARKRGPGRPYKPPQIPKKEDINKEDSGPSGNEEAQVPKTEPDLFCLACKSKIEPINNPGRVLTRSSYEQYGLDPQEKGAQDFRICLKCHCSGLRKKYMSCMLRTCTTLRRKAKLTRPVHPPRWKHLTEEQRNIVTTSIGIVPETTKCCSACFKKINRKIERVVNGDIDEDDLVEPHNENIIDNDGGVTQWSNEEMDSLKNIIDELGTGNWEQVSNRLKGRSANECRMRFAALSLAQTTADERRKKEVDVEVENTNSTKVVSSKVAAGIESEEEDNSDDDGLMILEPPASSSNTQSPLAVPLTEQKAGINVRTDLHKQVVTVGREMLRAQDSHSNESNATLSADEAEVPPTAGASESYMGEQSTNRAMILSARCSSALDPNLLPTPISTSIANRSSVSPSNPYKPKFRAIEEVKVEGPSPGPSEGLAARQQNKMRSVKSESPEVVEMVEHKPPPPPAVSSTIPAPLLSQSESKMQSARGSLTLGTPVCASTCSVTSQSPQLTSSQCEQTNPRLKTSSSQGDLSTDHHSPMQMESARNVDAQMLAALAQQQQMQLQQAQQLHQQQQMQMAARQQLALAQAHQYIQQQAAHARQWNMLDPQAQAIMLLHQSAAQSSRPPSTPHEDMNRVSVSQSPVTSTSGGISTQDLQLMLHHQQMLEQEQRRVVSEQHQRQLIQQTQQRIAEEQQRAMALARVHEHTERAALIHQQLQLANVAGKTRSDAHKEALIAAAVAEHQQKSLAKLAAQGVQSSKHTQQRPTQTPPGPSNSIQDQQAQSFKQSVIHENRVKSEPHQPPPAFKSKGAMKHFPTGNVTPSRPSSIAAPVARVALTEHKNPAPIARVPKSERNNHNTLARLPKVEYSNPAQIGRVHQPEPNNPAPIGRVSQAEYNNPAQIGRVPQAEYNNPAQIGRVPKAEYNNPAQIGRVPQAEYNNPAQMGRLPQAEYNNPAQIGRVHQPEYNNLAQIGRVPQTEYNNPAQIGRVAEPNHPSQIGRVPQPEYNNPVQIGRVPQAEYNNPAQIGRVPLPDYNNRAQTGRVPQADYNNPPQIGRVPSEYNLSTPIARVQQPKHTNLSPVTGVAQHEHTNSDMFRRTVQTEPTNMDSQMSRSSWQDLIGDMIVKNFQSTGHGIQEPVTSQIKTECASEQSKALLYAGGSKKQPITIGDSSPTPAVVQPPETASVLQHIEHAICKEYNSKTDKKGATDNLPESLPSHPISNIPNFDQATLQTVPSPKLMQSSPYTLAYPTSTPSQAPSVPSRIKPQTSNRSFSSAQEKSTAYLKSVGSPIPTPPAPPPALPTPPITTQPISTSSIRTASVPAPYTLAPTSAPAPSAPALHIPAPPVPAPSVLDPCVPTPGVPTPSVTIPSVPARCVPTPCVPTPSVPAPCVPTPCVPTPSVPDPCVPTPSVPAPCVPTPSVLTPSVPAPCVPTPSVPGPCALPTPSVPAPSVLATSVLSPSVLVPQHLVSRSNVQLSNIRVSQSNAISATRSPKKESKPSYTCDYEEISSDEEDKRPSTEASVSPAGSSIKSAALASCNSPAGLAQSPAPRSYGYVSLLDLPPQALSVPAVDPELTLAVQSITVAGTLDNPTLISAPHVSHPNIMSHVDHEAASAVNNLPTYEPLSDDES